MATEEEILKEEIQSKEKEFSDIEYRIRQYKNKISNEEDSLIRLKLNIEALTDKLYNKETK